MRKKVPNAYITNKTLGEAVDAILRGVERMFDSQDKRVDQRFKKVVQRFDRLEAGVRNIRRRMIDHEVDTPTRKEFSELKARVDKHHPLVD